jgi:hypothetical protein
METPIETAQEVTIREFLLRRIPRLVELQGEARLEQFRYVCGLAVQRVANGLIRPDNCITTLLQVAERGDVPAAAARRTIRQALGEAGRPPGHPALAQALKAALRAAPRPVSRSPGQTKPKRPRRRREGTLTAEREVWLGRLFHDGRAWSSTYLEGIARNLGWLKPNEAISQNSPFQDARRALGIRIRRRGFGRGARYEWFRPPTAWSPGQSS